MSDGNKVVGVALQPDRRIAFLALRDPVGPFVPRTITIQDVADLRGHAMPPQTSPIEITCRRPGGVVSGRVLHADGTPVPFANVRLFYPCPGGDDEFTGSASARRAPTPTASTPGTTCCAARRILAVDPEHRRVPRRAVQRRAQRPAAQRRHRDARPRHARGTDARRGRPAAEGHRRQRHQPDRSERLRRDDRRRRSVHRRAGPGRQHLRRGGQPDRECPDLDQRQHSVRGRDDQTRLRPADGRQSEADRGQTRTGDRARRCAAPAPNPLAGLPIVVYYQG